MGDAPPGRLLGDGWEPHVDEVDGELQYSIPVASGIADRVLSAEPDAVERFIDEVDAAHNIRLRVYIDHDLQRQREG